MAFPTSPQDKDRYNEHYFNLVENCWFLVSRMKKPFVYLTDSSSNGTGWISYSGTVIYTNVKDSNGSDYNVLNGIFTCPMDGKYRAYATALCGSASGSFQMYVCKNGTKLTSQGSHSNYQGSTYYSVSAEAVLNCSKGDTLNIRVETSSSNWYASADYSQAIFEMLE